MFQIVVNNGIPGGYDRLSKPAQELYEKYTLEMRTGKVLMRTDPALIRVFRELKESANFNGGDWVVVELDDRYKDNNHRIKSNGRIEWLEICDDSVWRAYIIE